MYVIQTQILETYACAFTKNLFTQLWQYGNIDEQSASVKTIQSHTTSRRSYAFVISLAS